MSTPQDRLTLLRASRHVPIPYKDEPDDAVEVIMKEVEPEIKIHKPVSTEEVDCFGYIIDVDVLVFVFFVLFVITMFLYAPQTTD